MTSIIQFKHAAVYYSVYTGSQILSDIDTLIDIDGITHIFSLYGPGVLIDKFYVFRQKKYPLL